ncbi:MAG: hypothetical protein QM808_06540 [Steroidobacteraceae bacterium]
MNTLFHKRTLLVTALVAAILSGCVVTPAHRYAVRGEVAVAPAPGLIWFDGYWGRGPHRHWVPGHWGPPRR